jgi:hypothetical protein
VTAQKLASTRKVLLALGGFKQKPLDYAANLCQRLAAGLDVLWLENEVPVMLEAFIHQHQADFPCQIVRASGGLAQAVLHQVAQDRRITVVVVDATEDGKPGQWWTQLPCPVVTVTGEGA